ncbi:hypothetical protein AGABI1DRAFT_103321 [Agaricus bisporus var. burnettii JB137-S8]|nr:uncharacterized protein AGABI1DRAFT_103321 [Agaricus bisporus var. burnettii JB137-S8]EKM74725.1 hypothetical protein AGABI1DRAFT_103321 [Agaricus bisporus var. burnettii JB137-S8]
MSLPPAKKDTSEHPAKGSVAIPVDRVQKDKDIDRKLHLYGVVEAFRRGRLPSNAQIDSFLNYLGDHPPVNVNELSSDGRKLVQDTRDILNTARDIVRDKNADELLQQFIWHTRDIDRETLAPGDVNQRLPVDRQTAQSDSQQAVRHLRTLLRIVMTNSEARKLLSDLSVIGRDLLSKTATKAAEVMAPSEDALRRADEPEQSNKFIDDDGGPTGPSGSSPLEVPLPGTGAAVTREEGETRLRNGDTSRNLDEAHREGKERLVGQGKETGRQVASEARQHAEDVRSSDAPGQEAQAKKAGFMDRMKGVTQTFSDRIPNQHKDFARDRYQQGRQFLTEEYFPEERRDRFIYRAKKVIMECQQHDDYQDSIRWLLNYIEEYAKHGKTATSGGGQSAQGIMADPQVNLAWREVRTLLERFANNTSLDTIFDSINILIDDSRRDPELRHWFENVDTYVRKILLEPGYVLDSTCNEQGRELRESGRHFYDDKYRKHFDNMFNSVSAWFNAMGEDPMNKRFGEDWARLTKDLLFDSEGSLKFKPELWNDIRKVVLPQIINQVGYVPIPRIEYTDDALDLVVENLTLQGRNLFPNILAVEANNYIKFSPYAAITDASHHRITLDLQQMQADMRDVAFYYRKKGMPRMTDSGLADVVLGGQGLSALITLHSPTKDKTSVFKVQDVQVKVDTLKFSIRDSKHDFLYKTLKPLATVLIKKQIQKAIKDALITGLEYIDGQLVAVRDRMDTAKRTEGESQTDALMSIFKKEKEGGEGSIKGSVRGSQAEKASHFKVVSHKRDSLLKEGNPSGWVNRTDEREAAAAAGAEWRSDA